MKKLLLALALATMASVASVMLCNLAMGPFMIEEARVASPTGGDVAIVLRRAPVSPIGPAPDDSFAVVLQGPGERRIDMKGVIWESTEVEPAAIDWVSPETLRVSVLKGSHGRSNKESVRTHKKRGVTVVTAWVTETPDTLGTKIWWKR